MTNFNLLWWEMNPAFMDHCIDAAAWLCNMPNPFIGQYGDALRDSVAAWLNGGEL
jgi:hypothetical protein